jgi:hypothetical protein
VNAQHGSELAAGGDAVTGTQITGVYESAKLVAKLDVQGNVTFWLEVHWEHCLSP